MNEMLQDDECLATQTQGCCEGGRRPAWPDRKKLTKEGVAHYYPDDPGPECIIPVDFREITPQFSQEQKDKIAAIADGTDEAAQVIQERGEIYGPFDVNMYGTALQISGMLAQFYGRTDLPVLPAYMAAMIATAFKSNRIVKSPTHEDSHLDLGVYLGKAKELGSN